eukprot:g35742.t1
MRSEEERAARLGVWRWRAGQSAVKLREFSPSDGAGDLLIQVSALEGQRRLSRSRSRSPLSPAPGTMPPTGSTVTHEELKLRIQRLIDSHNVLVFSKTFCPYCKK